MYKRQLLPGQAGHQRQIAVACRQGQGAAVGIIQEEGGLAALRPGDVPVSYTHLAVYKRQDVQRRRCRRAGVLRYHRQL